MSDRQHNYPDSTGSRREAAAGGRPVFYERTEAIDQPERPPRADGGYLTRPPAGPSGNEPAAAEAGYPPRRPPPAESAPASFAADSSLSNIDGHAADPELAAAAGLSSTRGGEAGPYPPAGPQPHYQPPAQQPPPQGPPPQQAPPPPQYQQPQALEDPHQQAQHSGGAVYEPTQLHSPVSAASSYPEQVGDGVYRRSRPGLGVALALVMAAMAGMVGFMLVDELRADGPVSPSAAMAATFALAGLPLAGFGLYPILGSGSKSGPDHVGALLRPPYIYLIAGLTLFLAAGLAA